DEILQFLARLEVRHLLLRNLYLVAGLRIAAAARLPSPQTKTAEAAQFDLLAAVQREDDALEDGVDDDLGVLLRKVRGPRDFFDEFGFGHQESTETGRPGPTPAADRTSGCLLQVPEVITQRHFGATCRLGVRFPVGAVLRVAQRANAEADLPLLGDEADDLHLVRLVGL